MPRAACHLTFELLALPLALLGAYWWGLRGELLPFGVGYLVGSFFLSPDLDLFQSRATRRWGILKVIWWPYAQLFRHRGLSHHPLLGPFSRLLYLAAVLAIVGLHFAGLPFPRFWVVPSLLGFWLPQLLHILLDLLWR